MSRRRICKHLFISVIFVNLSMPLARAGENLDSFRVKQFEDVVKGLYQEEKLALSGAEDEDIGRAPLMEKAALFEARRWQEKRAPRIRLNYSQGYAYDSNVYTKSDSEQSSAIISENPGANLTWGNGKFILGGNYLVNILQYLHQSRLSRTDQNGTGNVFYRLGGKTSLAGYYRFGDKRSAPNSSESELRRTQDHEGSFVLNRRLSRKFSTQLMFHWRGKDYMESLLRENSSDYYAAEWMLNYHFHSKLSAFLDFTYGETTSRNLAFKNKEYLIGGGLQGRVAPKTTVFLNMRMRFNDYSEAGEDATGLSIEGLAHYRVSSKSVFQLALNHDIQSSLDGVNSYFTSTSCAVSLNSRLTAQWSGTLGAFYRFNQSPGPITVSELVEERLDHSFGGQAGLSYKINRNWTCRGGYSYGQRSANFGIFDFVDHRADVSIGVTF